MRKPARPFDVRRVVAAAGLAAALAAVAIVSACSSTSSGTPTSGTGGGTVGATSPSVATALPTSLPTVNLSGLPTSIPTSLPSGLLSGIGTTIPSSLPSYLSSFLPSGGRTVPTSAAFCRLLKNGGTDLSVGGAQHLQKLLAYYQKLADAAPAQLKPAVQDVHDYLGAISTGRFNKVSAKKLQSDIEQLIQASVRCNLR